MYIYVFIYIYNHNHERFIFSFVMFPTLINSYKDVHPRVLEAVSIRKTVLPGMAIPMLKIRRPNGRLIFNMDGLYIETGPWIPSQAKQRSLSKTAPGQRLSEQPSQHVYVYWLIHSVELHSKVISPALVNGYTKIYIVTKQVKKVVNFKNEWGIQFNGLSGDSGHRGPYSPYKPCNQLKKEVMMLVGD